MTKYNTGNPVGSADPRDLYDNAENTDVWVLSKEKEMAPDRLGVQRKTWHGMEKAFDDFLASSGYQNMGTYGAGIEFTAYNQTVFVGGTAWRLAASTGLPYTTTGAGMPEGGAFVDIGDAVLRQELAGDPADGLGASLVNGSVIWVSSVAEMKAYNVPANTQFNLEAAGLSGMFVFRAGNYASEVTADPFGAFYIARAGDPTGGSGVFERIDKAVVHQSWFGIVDNPLIDIDQTARVKSFWDLAATQSMGVAWDMTVGIADKLNTPSNLNLLCKNVTLKVRTDFDGGTGFREAISSENASDVQVEGLRLDGNESALGGLTPVFVGDPVRGFAVIGGCDNVTFRSCRADNVQANAFIHFSGGAYTQSKNVIFDNCVSENSGLGFGQEIVQGTVVTPEGPGYTEYRNCRAILCNYGLYVAGGEFKVIGGYYQAKRLRALVVYTGDGHAVTKGDIQSATFRMTPETGNNPCAEFKCINEQSTAPNYEAQQDLDVTLSGVCKFIQDEPTGINLKIKEGCNVKCTGPVLIGGVSCIRTEQSSLTGGPYRPGVIVFDAPKFRDFQTDGIRADMEISLTDPVFSSPAGVSAAGVELVTGGVVRMKRPTFGAATDATTLDKGVTTTASGTRAIVTEAKPENVTTLFSVTVANAALWDVEKTEGGSAFDRNIIYGSGSPEGVVAAALGRVYVDTDGGAGTTLYVKESVNLGSTGWVAK
ncbi:hypothetical protein BKP64_11030 [Marinobacter salinus]|uniref:Uncharacterized protein n=1 Tax=Marinobacter salinus TaxID=1874317 RepID=A0A1D9GLZ0_9GAMM|nr:hypothetical protein [Marinobacter salinus]AOY88662.1 hypothetical protein BKP64_11030 [Marinobacter salinus]